MKAKLLNLLDQKKYKVFGQAASLDEARHIATRTLDGAQLYAVNEAIDVYHNTLLTVIEKDVQRL